MMILKPPVKMIRMQSSSNDVLQSICDNSRLTARTVSHLIETDRRAPVCGLPVRFRLQKILVEGPVRTP